MTEAIKARKVLVALAALLLLLGGGSGLARAAQDGQAAPANHAPTGPGSCSDGKDNDHDGEFDGADDDCREDGRNNEGDGDNDDAPNCSDGKDNDRDGDTDFPKDKGCKGPNDGSERSERRGNGDDDDDKDNNNRATLTIEKTVRNAGGGEFDFEFLVECEREGRRGPVVREVEIEDVSNNETDSESVRLRRGDRCEVTEQGDGNNRWRTTADGEQGSTASIRLRNDNNRVRFVNTRRDRNRDNDRDLRIVKHLVDNTGAPRDYTFTFDVTCGNRTETVTMRFQGDRTRRTREVEDIRRGAQCTVTERDPGAGFTTTPANRTQTVTMNDDRRVEFTNTRQGTAPPATADTADVTINKVVHDSRGYRGPYTFTYDVTCTDGFVSRGVTVTAITPTTPGATPTATGSTAFRATEGSTCTITEREANPDERENPNRQWSSTWATSHGEQYTGAPGQQPHVATITVSDDDNGTTSDAERRNRNVVTFTNTFLGGTTTAQTFCGEQDPREGLQGAGGGTIAQALYDNLLAELGILQDPERNGPLSGPLGGLPDPIGVEVACLISLLDGEEGAAPPN